jgi:flagellar M-ring protein FliF
MQIVEQIKALPTKKKIIVLTVLVLSISAFILLIVWIQRPEYQTLYSNLSQEDAALIIQKLKEKKIPYRVSGNLILVPSDKVYELRLQLASEGVPQGGSVGFELFDKTSFTMTDFVQKLNYRRALQGELARTIKSITAIEECRVHLAIPEKSLFVQEEERPKASILVKLRPGKGLTQEQVQGIVHLVSSSVDGLNPKDVTIVDQTGEVLTAPTDEDNIGITKTQLELQRNYEKDMEKRIKKLLEPVVGRGKVEAKVTAIIDFTKIEKTEERIDPESQVIISEQRNTERSTNGTVGGVPGVASNLPDKAAVQSETHQSQSEKKEETINYEVSKVVSRIMTAPGEIKRVSAVVLIDSASKQKVIDEAKAVPFSEEEIKQIEEMVKKAIGFTAERGDEVKVISMPFEKLATLEEEPPTPKREVIPLVIGNLKYIVPVLAILLLVLFVIRPLIKTLTTLPTQAERFSPQTVTTETQKAIEKTEKPLKDRITEWVHQNPEEAAELVKSWLEEK